MMHEDREFEFASSRVSHRRGVFLMQWKQVALSPHLNQRRRRRSQLLLIGQNMHVWLQSLLILCENCLRLHREGSFSSKRWGRACYRTRAGWSDVQSTHKHNTNMQKCKQTGTKTDTIASSNSRCLSWLLSVCSIIIISLPWHAITQSTTSGG